MKAIGGFLALFVTVPIWFCLLYQILEAVHATLLMWVLYWVYVPAETLVNHILKVYEES